MAKRGGKTTGNKRQRERDKRRKRESKEARKVERKEMRDRGEDPDIVELDEYGDPIFREPAPEEPNASDDEGAQEMQPPSEA